MSSFIPVGPTLAGFCCTRVDAEQRQQQQQQQSDDDGETTRAIPTLSTYLVILSHCRSANIKSTALIRSS